LKKAKKRLPNGGQTPLWQPFLYVAKNYIGTKGSRRLSTLFHSLLPGNCKLRKKGSLARALLFYYIIEHSHNKKVLVKSIIEANNNKQI